MRVLIATPLYPPEVGGPATYTAEMESLLPEHGFEVSVVSFSRVKHLPYVIRHIVYFWVILRKMGQCDAVYAQDPLGVGLPAVFVARLRRKKAVVRIAGDRAWETGVQKFGVADDLDTFAARWTFNPIIWILKIAQWKTTLFAHAVVTPSNYMNRIVVSWGVAEKKVHTIYNGVNLQAIPQCAPKEHFNKTIISAGRLVPWKGFSALIEVMIDMPQWRLLIAGDGPQRENLKKQVTRHKLQSRVLFLGSLGRDVLFKNMCEADVFVLNTRYEGLSHMLIEVMAAGVPIITTDIGGNPELIVNDEQGLLVTPDEKDQMKKALVRLENDDNMRARLTASAREKAQVFSIESSINQLKTLMQSL